MQEGSRPLKQSQEISIVTEMKTAAATHKGLYQMVAQSEARETAKPQEEGCLCVGVRVEHDCLLEILKKSHLICFQSLKLKSGQSLWNIGLSNDSKNCFDLKDEIDYRDKMWILLKKRETWPWPQPGKGSVRICLHSSALSSLHGLDLSAVSPPVVSQTLLQGSCLLEGSEASHPLCSEPFLSTEDSGSSLQIGTFVSADPLKLCRAGLGPLVAISWFD